MCIKLLTKIPLQEISLNTQVSQPKTVVLSSFLFRPATRIKQFMMLEFVKSLEVNSLLQKGNKISLCLIAALSSQMESFKALK